MFIFIKLVNSDFNFPISSSWSIICTNIQTGSCPALGLASKEPSTKKTSTVLIAMKQTSDASHAVAPNSTIQSIDLAKSQTSLALFCDDIESAAQRNKLVMETGLKKESTVRCKLFGKIETQKKFRI